MPEATVIAVLGAESTGKSTLAMALQPASRPAPAQAEGPRWQWLCERCGDPDCERHLLPRP